jgi:hypothetical protein
VKNLTAEGVEDAEEEKRNSRKDKRPAPQRTQRAQRRERGRKGKKRKTRTRVERETGGGILHLTFLLCFSWLGKPLNGRRDNAW